MLNRNTCSDIEIGIDLLPPYLLTIDHRVSIAVYTIRQNHQLKLAMLLLHRSLSFGHRCEWQNQGVSSMYLLEWIACDFPKHGLMGENCRSNFQWKTNGFTHSQKATPLIEKFKSTLHYNPPVRNSHVQIETFLT